MQAIAAWLQPHFWHERPAPACCWGWGILVRACGAPQPQPLPAWAQQRHFQPHADKWRRFEVTTTVTVAEPNSTDKLCSPAPDTSTDWQRPLDNMRVGNATQAGLVSDSARGARMLHAEFAATVKALTLTLSSLLETRNRTVYWTQRGRFAEDPATLREMTAPTDATAGWHRALDGPAGHTRCAQRCRENAGDLRLSHCQRLPQTQDAWLRHRRHQGNVAERQDGR